MGLNNYLTKGFKKHAIQHLPSLHSRHCSKRLSPTNRPIRGTHLSRRDLRHRLGRAVGPRFSARWTFAGHRARGTAAHRRHRRRDFAAHRRRAQSARQGTGRADGCDLTSPVRGDRLDLSQLLGSAAWAIGRHAELHSHQPRTAARRRVGRCRSDSSRPRSILHSPLPPLRLAHRLRPRGLSVPCDRRPAASGPSPRT